MRKDSLFLILLCLFISCKSEKKDNSSEEIATDLAYDSEASVRQANLERLEHDISWMHPEFFGFKNYKEYRINDTISIDLNGNGILEKIYFNRNNHHQLYIDEKGAQRIVLGNKSGTFSEFPSTMEWVNLWSVVSDDQVTQVLFEENGPVLKDSLIAMEGPGIYIGREVLGGGIITYRKNKLSWIHQSYEEHPENP
ncbi:hypothetical protein [Spongiimicrobium salis]|uniref:hypothetical protein n=1 Tax=Spongiimicrobium salis TaxID=1667022 RepID=UPI00374CD9AB